MMCRLTPTYKVCKVRTDEVFTVLASPVRRALLDLLRQEPRSASELASEFDMRRPSVSEHLRVLREVGLVDVEPRGRQRIYHIRPDPLREVAEWLHPYEAFWRTRLAGLRELLDDQETS